MDIGHRFFMGHRPVRIGAMHRHEFGRVTEANKLIAADPFLLAGTTKVDLRN